MTHLLIYKLPWTKFLTGFSDGKSRTSKHLICVYLVDTVPLVMG